MGLGFKLGGPVADGGAPAMGGPGAFGHAGHGGSIGFADSERGLAFGRTKSLLRATDTPEQSTAYRVAEVVRAYLDA
jgi:CubicO group peptidase (beta-lactamase class C family)